MASSSSTPPPAAVDSLAGSIAFLSQRMAELRQYAEEKLAAMGHAPTSTSTTTWASSSTTPSITATTPSTASVTTASPGSPRSPSACSVAALCTPDILPTGAQEVFDEMSNHQEVSMGGVLRVTVSDMPWPLADEVLLQVFEPYGCNKVLVLERMSCMVAYIFFHPSHDASQAQKVLHGRCIYDNCCWLDVQIVSRPSTCSSGVQATKTTPIAATPSTQPSRMTSPSVTSASTMAVTPAAAPPTPAAPSGRVPASAPISTPVAASTPAAPLAAATTPSPTHTFLRFPPPPFLAVTKKIKKRTPRKRRTSTSAPTARYASHAVSSSERPYRAMQFAMVRDAAVPLHRGCPRRRQGHQRPPRRGRPPRLRTQGLGMRPRPWRHALRHRHRRPRRHRHQRHRRSGHALTPSCTCAARPMAFSLAACSMPPASATAFKNLEVRKLEVDSVQMQQPGPPPKQLCKQYAVFHLRPPPVQPFSSSASTVASAMVFLHDVSGGDSDEDANFLECKISTVQPSVQFCGVTMLTRQLQRSIHFHSPSECDQAWLSVGLFVYKDALFSWICGKCSMVASGHDLLPLANPPDQRGSTVLRFELLLAPCFALWDSGGVVLQLVWSDMLHMSSHFILVLLEKFWNPVLVPTFAFKVFCKEANLQFNHLEANQRAQLTDVNVAELTDRQLLQNSLVFSDIWRQFRRPVAMGTLRSHSVPAGMLFGYNQSIVYRSIVTTWSKFLSGAFWCVQLQGDVGKLQAHVCKLWDIIQAEIEVLQQVILGEEQQSVLRMWTFQIISCGLLHCWTMTDGLQRSWHSKLLQAIKLPYALGYGLQQDAKRCTGLHQVVFAGSLFATILCKLRMVDGEEALSDAYQHRMMRPVWEKVGYCQAAAHMLLKEYNQANGVLLDAQKVDPDNVEIEHELIHVCRGVRSGLRASRILSGGECQELGRWMGSQAGPVQEQQNNTKLG